MAMVAVNISLRPGPSDRYYPDKVQSLSGLPLSENIADVAETDEEGGGGSIVQG